MEEAEVPAELMNRPFKELSKEERVLVARARSRAMRAKAGVPVAGPAESSAEPVAAAPTPVEEETVAAAPEVVADPMAEVPPELLQKPFKDLNKEEKVIVARARSRAVRAKSGLLVSEPAEAAPAPAAAAEPEPAAVEEAPAAVATASADADGDADADDPMAEVPPELLSRPFKELSKEERVIVARARSRAVRAKAGKS